MNKGPKIAILYFSRNPHAEARVKPLHESVRKNQGIWKFLKSTILEKIATSGHKVIIWDETKQIGNTFGERFTHAFSTVFSMGFEYVISVGNDCVSIGREDLRRASLALESDKVAFGPSIDGGVFLIGMPRESFDPHPFEHITWNTHHVLKELTKLFPVHCLLDKKADIDAKEDLMSILSSRLLNKKINQILFNLLQHFNATGFYNFPRWNLKTEHKLLSRPPPAIT